MTKFDSIEQLTNELHSLPGITKKTAEKISYYLIFNKDRAKQIIEAINSIEKIKKCQKCNSISKKEICDICNDPSRNKILIIVQSHLDITKFEKMNMKAKYYVLPSLLDSSGRKLVDENMISTIKDYGDKFEEIIFALSSTLDGITTTNYLKTLFPENKVTELAHGIPLGVAIEYVDEITLKASFENRKRGGK